MPHYEVIQVSGKAHAQLFEVRCQIDEPAITTTATGRSRRKAEQQAAQAAIAELQQAFGLNSHD